MKRKRAVLPEDVSKPCNPLRDKKVLTEAARVQAAVLSRQPRGCTVTAVEFCASVLREQLGLHEFAIGQWVRVTVSAARKDSLGEEDRSRVLKPAPAVPLQIPSITDCARALGDIRSASNESESVAERIQARLVSRLDKQALLTEGAILLSSVLSEHQAAEVATQLAEAALGPETRLRASTGNGMGGAYQAIPPAAVSLLDVLSSELAKLLSEKLQVSGCGSKALALRYGRGGVNWAHVDQSACPFQAVLLLSRPRVDFNGGELYVTDIVRAYHGDPSATKEVQWEGIGDVVVFAANGSGSGGEWYHGMRAVTPGVDGCRRLAVGLLQT